RYGGGDDAFSYRIFGKGFTIGPQQHADGKNYDDWRRGQLGFRTDARLGDHDQLTVQGDIYGGDAGQILQISSYSPPVNPAIEGEKLFNGENVMAAWKHEFAGGSDILLRAYWDRTDRQE